MRHVLIALLEVLGLIWIAVGCALAWRPLGFITAGAALIWIAYQVEHR